MTEMNKVASPLLPQRRTLRHHGTQADPTTSVPTSPTVTAH